MAQCILNKLTVILLVQFVYFLNVTVVNVLLGSDIFCLFCFRT